MTLLASCSVLGQTCRILDHCSRREKPLRYMSLQVGSAMDLQPLSIPNGAWPWSRSFSPSLSPGTGISLTPLLRRNKPLWMGPWALPAHFLLKPVGPAMCSSMYTHTPAEGASELSACAVQKRDFCPLHLWCVPPIWRTLFGLRVAGGFFALVLESVHRTQRLLPTPDSNESTGGEGA